MSRATPNGRLMVFEPPPCAGDESIRMQMKGQCWGSPPPVQMVNDRDRRLHARTATGAMGRDAVVDTECFHELDVKQELNFAKPSREKLDQTLYYVSPQLPTRRPLCRLLKAQSVYDATGSRYVDLVLIAAKDSVNKRAPRKATHRKK